MRKAVEIYNYVDEYGIIMDRLEYNELISELTEANNQEELYRLDIYLADIKEKRRTN